LEHTQSAQKLQEEIDSLRRINLVAEGAKEVAEERWAAEQQNAAAELTREAQEKEEATARQAAADLEALRMKYEEQLKSLQIAVAKAHAEVDASKAAQEQLQLEQQKLHADLLNAKRAESAAKDEVNSNAAHVAQLEGQLFSTLSLKMKQEGELSMLKEKLSAAEQTACEAEKARAEAAAAQVNHEKKKSEGASKELKRVMKENAAAMAEFEKALIRKSEECNLLYDKLRAAEQGSEAPSSANSSPGGVVAAVGSSVSEGMKRLGRSSFTSGLFGGSKKSNGSSATSASNDEASQN